MLCESISAAAVRATITRAIVTRGTVARATLRGSEMRTRCSMSMLLLVLIACPAVGQVLVPPPPPPPEEPEYTPPPRPEPRERPQPRQNQRQQRPQRVEAPDVAFRSPARPIELDPDEAYDGPFITYQRPMQQVVVRFNPLIDEQTAEELRGILATRADTLEDIVLEHLGTVLRVREGMMDNFSMQDIEGMQAMTREIQPLMLEGDLISAALEAGVVSPETAALHNEIIRQYQVAYREDTAERLPEEEVLNAFLRFVLRDSLWEAENTYLNMLAEAGTRIDGVLEEMNLPEDVESSLRAIEGDRARAERDRRYRRELAQRVELAIRGLSTQQKRAFLERVIATRSDAEGRLLPIISTDRPKTEG